MIGPMNRPAWQMNPTVRQIARKAPDDVVHTRMMPDVLDRDRHVQDAWLSGPRCLRSSSTEPTRISDHEELGLRHVENTNTAVVVSGRLHASPFRRVASDRTPALQV
jgi:hypothetical protein